MNILIGITIVIIGAFISITGQDNIGRNLAWYNDNPIIAFIGWIICCFGMYFIACAILEISWLKLFEVIYEYLKKH
jgi:amino acid transporter